MSLRPDRKRKKRTPEEKAAWAAYMREYWRQRPEAYAAMLAKQRARKPGKLAYHRHKDKPEFQQKKKAAGKRYWKERTKHPEHEARLQRKRNMDGARHYGMDPTEYAKRKEANCDICGVHVPRGKQGGGMHIDHNHTTGQIRGTLCRDCNTGLGVFGEDIARLETAAAYLRLWEERAKATA